MASKEDIDKIMKQLQVLMAGQDAVNNLGDRLTALEERASGSGIEVKQEHKEQTPGTVTSNINVSSSSREKALTLTFGDSDCSPSNLRLFIEHYGIAREQNLAKEVQCWNDAKFRARELRFQLRGEPSLWLAQECAMLREWTNDDQEIIRKLKDRYMGTQSVELNIISFEELAQEEGESLAKYMTRCQVKGYEAFGQLNEPLGTTQRIVWKFLAGIKDVDVRKAVINAKWMKSDKEALTFDEVLKIAETERMNKEAASKTAPHESKGQGKVASVKDRRSYNARTPHSSSESGHSSGSSRSIRSSSSDTSKPPHPPNFKCHYCNTTSHFGGWRACKKRLTEDPTWTPTSGKVFQRTP